jgi:hypothetical protein
MCLLVLDAARAGFTFEWEIAARSGDLKVVPTNLAWENSGEDVFGACW